MTTMNAYVGTNNDSYSLVEAAKDREALMDKAEKHKVMVAGIPEAVLGMKKTVEPHTRLTSCYRNIKRQQQEGQRIEKKRKKEDKNKSG
jgi:hypothetical protein